MGRIKMEGPSGENRLKADTETRCNRHFVGQTWSLRIFLPLLSLFFSLSSLFLLEGEERFVRIMGYDKPIECFGEISCDHSLGVTQDFESTFLEKCTENVYTFRTCYYLPNLLRLFEEERFKRERDEYRGSKWSGTLGWRLHWKKKSWKRMQIKKKHDLCRKRNRDWKTEVDEVIEQLVRYYRKEKEILVETWIIRITLKNTLILNFLYIQYSIFVPSLFL